MEILGALLSGIGYGMVLMFPGRWWALLPWAAGNPLLMLASLSAGLKYQALLFAIYWGGTVWGIVRWSGAGGKVKGKNHA